MAVPKKRTSISKKRIRRNIWRKKGHLTAVKASSLAKSVSTENSNSFIKKKSNSKGFSYFLQCPIEITSIEIEQTIEIEQSVTDQSFTD